MISEVSFHINRFRFIFCNLPMITFSLALSADFLSLQKAPTLPPPMYSKTLLNHAQEKLLKKTPRASTQQKKALKRSNSRQKPSKAFQNLFQLSLKSLQKPFKTFFNCLSKAFKSPKAFKSLPKPFSIVSQKPSKAFQNFFQLSLKSLQEP